MKKKKSRWSGSQMEVLSALCDAFLPSINPPSSSSNHSHPLSSIITHFYQTSASMAGTPHHLAVLLEEKLEHPKLYLSKLAVWLLSTWIGTFILCGRRSISPQFPYFKRFSELSLQQREAVLHSWSESNFYLLRILFTALKIFILLLFFTQVNEKQENDTWAAIDYRRPKPDNAEKFGPLEKGIVRLSHRSKEESVKRLQSLGFPASTPQHSTKNITNCLNPSFIIKCDALIVGSGSGGGVVAGVLAKAGYKVLVLEKGSYFARSQLSLLEGEAMDRMYLGHGIMGTDNMDVLLLAGSTVGGGSKINWSASIRTPPHVVRDWSENHGLHFFRSRGYEHAMDVVCGRMGVQSKIDNEGFNNMVLRRGSERLGFPTDTIPRNAPSNHYCGSCCMGCKDGSKKDVSETWLMDMVELGNGIVLPECEAVEVITQQNRGSCSRRKAIGASFVFDDYDGVRRTAVVDARVTVVACGAICTPPLLTRSGLRNASIGKNLHLHPVVMGWGYFPDGEWPESEKKSYEGGIMTAMSKVTESSTYDTIIQTPALHPGMFSALMPWQSGADMRQRMLKFSRTAHIFALARDKGSGVVTSPTNISYKMAKCDEDNLRGGLERVLRILAAAGADEIGTHHKKGRVLKVKEASAEELERFLEEEMSRALEKLSSPICSAHQMGSCRMGTDPKHSAVAPTGETWEVEGLYVADSSVFPSALGVNPMVTIQAIAYCTAQSILNVLNKKSEK
ncbi:long-chain-alcohol oxidase FAO4A-like [Andrographis paniculata]|uniref:long-chain-alcohol oxidase FAO4A-like n=1 Tax=Andrographis paniculata TaxID=175694 RepID=UPI0021E70490|nr:long-chain-alcohol oxidase FAO4A-like [Andrographis paniculata]XP_051151602.1 long-chain-alcohol oxidase FAO4A-like [Andrographis paniculata]